MVSAAQPLTQPQAAAPSTDARLLPSPLRFCSVSLRQVQRNGMRLDASAYDIDAIKALNLVHRNPYGWVCLWGCGGLVKDAYYPGRYKRIYTSEDSGEAFYLPSQLEEVYPHPTKYISHKTANLLSNDRIESNNLLLSRSGTIGKCAVSSKTTIGKLFSDDVIRVSFTGKYDLGYTYAFFKTETGLKILQSNNYGAVIDHIEPEHLSNIPIPNAPDNVKRQIHEAVVASYDLRDQSNVLIDQARQSLYDALRLPAKPRLTPQYYADAGFRCFFVPSSRLNRRLDASYHLPEAAEVVRLISRHAREVTTLGDPRISKEIRVGSRFKRVYVQKQDGVAYLNGKAIMQLDPNGCEKKYLSLSMHGEQIRKQLTLQANTILITCSGTLGKVVIVPKHWQGWATTHDIIRLIPCSDSIVGYIYCYLNCPLGQLLIKRGTYGAVVDHLEPMHIAEVPIPILQDEAAQLRINALVLKANELRYRSYLKEQEAITQIEEVLHSNTKKQ